MEWLLLAWILSQPLHEGDIEDYGYAVHTLDCLQTYEIFHNDKYREANPLIKSWQFGCAMGYIQHYTANKLLPRTYKPVWNWTYAIAKTGVVAHNYHIGIRVRF